MGMGKKKARREGAGAKKTSAPEKKRKGDKYQAVPIFSVGCLILVEGVGAVLLPLKHRMLKGRLWVTGFYSCPCGRLGSDPASDTP